MIVQRLMKQETLISARQSGSDTAFGRNSPAAEDVINRDSFRAKQDVDLDIGRYNNKMT
ncbi:hypothetical protein [Brucella pituitosa]|uniref:hypothetical protein n=1 Tax=Brucella pituitosa TaxID=571256 RepID=UPI0013747B63|nr:hypothetical protein [Brucella pituitosa]